MITCMKNGGRAMNMTYRKLAKEISQFSDEQLDLSVSVYIPEIDEYYPIDVVGVNVGTKKTDVLGNGHPVLQISNGD